MKLSLSTVAIPESQVGLSMCGPHRTGLVASAAFGDSYGAIQGRARAERTKSTDPQSSWQGFSGCRYHWQRQKKMEEGTWMPKWSTWSLNMVGNRATNLTISPNFPKVSQSLSWITTLEKGSGYEEGAAHVWTSGKRNEFSADSRGWQISPGEHSSRPVSHSSSEPSACSLWESPLSLTRVSSIKSTYLEDILPTPNWINPEQEKLEVQGNL